MDQDLFEAYLESIERTPEEIREFTEFLQKVYEEDREREEQDFLYRLWEERVDTENAFLASEIYCI